jgi:hypothetical protein
MNLGFWPYIGAAIGKLLLIPAKEIVLPGI